MQLYCDYLLARWILPIESQSSLAVGDDVTGKAQNRWFVFHGGVKHIKFAVISAVQDHVREVTTWNSRVDFQKAMLSFLLATRHLSTE